MEKNAIYRKYAVIIVDPFFGVEYAMTDRILLITKVGNALNVAERQSCFATGARVYAGVIFFHARKTAKSHNNL